MHNTSICKFQMANRDLWNYYMQTRTSIQTPQNTIHVPSSPPYDNLNVIDAPTTISLQPTQRSQNHPPPIPGPGQLIRQGLFRKRSHDVRVLQGESSQTRPTQDFINEVINEPLQVDQVFSSPLWTSVIDYLIREGCHNNRSAPLWTQIGEIRVPSSQFVKVKKIVAMISTMTPNHQGDFMVTLKDPTGKIEGSMHHNIFINNEYRLTTTVGAVVILQNVTVSRFTRNSKYINITAQNIIKIVGATSMIAKYEPTETANVEDEYEGTSGYDFETVPDSDEE